MDDSTVLTIEATFWRQPDHFCRGIVGARRLRARLALRLSSQIQQVFDAASFPG